MECRHPAQSRLDADMAAPQSILARSVVALLRLYQLTLSPALGSHCRFSPSCSEFARQAVLRHGLWRGLGYGIRRVLRCHPYHPGGWDPVP